MSNLNPTTSAIQTLNIAGHQLAYACLNPGATGEPVILIHGITSTVSLWQINPLPVLLNIGPCYSISLPGHFPALAPSAFKNSPLSAETVVNLLDDAVRQIIGESPATLIGHSTGGFAVLGLAANRPALARRVVSICGFAHGRWTGILGVYQRAVNLGWPGVAYFKLMFQILKLHPALYRWALRFYAADQKALYAYPDTSKAVEVSYPSFRSLDLEAMIPYFRDMPHIDISSQLSKIKAPTLAICGADDPIVPPDQSRHIVRQISGATLTVIAGAGHLPFSERSAEYATGLSSWLARHP
jgi:pimeloyl-ACP methyl ester carboxylesterase